MRALLHQRVGGVDYLAVFPPGVDLPAPDAIRSEFAGRSPPGPDAIRVELAAGRVPGLSSWRTLAACGPTWSIRQNGARRCLCLGDPLDDPPSGRAVCWEGGARRATLYCGADLAGAGADGVRLVHAAGYPVDQMLLIYYLAGRRGLLVHAAGVVAGERALLFPGVSGAGKSTLARRFLAREESRLLSDDRILVRLRDDACTAFGTPWPGDAGVAVNAGAPLAAILFPARGAETRIRRLSPQAALDRLLPAVSILWHERALLFEQLETCDLLLRRIPAYELSWSPGAGIVDDIRAFAAQL